MNGLRASAALWSGDHVACVKLRGGGAQDLLDRVSPRALFGRAGRMSHTLLLDDAARPLADVYVCCDEEDHYVLAEGMSAPAVIDYLRAHAAELDVAFEDLTQSHAMMCLAGPYAWELLGELTTPDVIGLSYLSFFHDEQFTCFRGGKTGEFGYDLLIERARVDAVRDRVLTLGRKFELAELTLADVEVAQVESFFWNPRALSRPDLTPIELQLQWRVDYAREFPGATALAERRKLAHQRIALVASPSQLTAGATLVHGDRELGEVLQAVHSPTRGDWIGIALCERAFAHAGLDGLRAGDAAVTTLSAPAINNRSLYIDPQRHCFATRTTDEFPPLVRT